MAAEFDLPFAQQLCDLVYNDLGYVCSFMGEGGVIAVSSARDRIGVVHAGAAAAIPCRALLRSPPRPAKNQSWRGEQRAREAQTSCSPRSWTQEKAGCQVQEADPNTTALNLWTAPSWRFL